MSASVKCGACAKTAYPLESIVANNNSYHKGCFKCSTCNATLNVKTFKSFEGKLYCPVHTPKVSATAVTDSVALKNALNAPKKVAEGLGNAHRGLDEKPNIGLDSMATANALKAPKKVAEGLGNAQKGTGGKPTYAVFGADGQPTGEQEQQQYTEEQYEQPQEEEQQQEEQQYEEQQYEEQQYEEQQYTEEQQYEEEQ
ncbi:hypothetical protein ACTFIZ_010809 [Dictyostelium cf. discoideum]